MERQGLTTPPPRQTPFSHPVHGRQRGNAPVVAEDLTGRVGTAPPWHLCLPPRPLTSFFSPGRGGRRKEEPFTSGSATGSSEAGFSVFASSASAVPAHEMLTMSLAPGKSDLRFKRIFIQRHRCSWEISSEDGSYVFNKWPWWKPLSGERTFRPGGRFPSGVSQLHLPGSHALLQSFLSRDKTVQLSLCLR